MDLAPSSPPPPWARFPNRHEPRTDFSSSPTPRAARATNAVCRPARAGEQAATIANEMFGACAAAVLLGQFAQRILEQAKEAGAVAKVAIAVDNDNDNDDDNDDDDDDNNGDDDN